MILRSAARLSFTRTLLHGYAIRKGSSRTQYTHMSLNIEKVVNFCFVTRIKPRRLRFYEKTLLILIMVIHSYFTFYSWKEHGYLGFFPPFSNSNTTQIFSDLLISLSLVNVWIFFDVKRTGKSIMYFVIVLLGTALLGSYSPLMYLLMREHYSWHKDNVSPS